jgi:hypothetical protein
VQGYLRCPRGVATQDRYSSLYLSIDAVIGWSPPPTGAPACWPLPQCVACPSPRGCSAGRLRPVIDDVDFANYLFGYAAAAGLCSLRRSSTLRSCRDRRLLSCPASASDKVRGIRCLELPRESHPGLRMGASQSTPEKILKYVRLNEHIKLEVSAGSRVQMASARGGGGSGGRSRRSCARLTCPPPLQHLLSFLEAHNSDYQRNKAAFLEVQDANGSTPLILGAQRGAYQCVALVRLAPGCPAARCLLLWLPLGCARAVRLPPCSCCATGPTYTTSTGGQRAAVPSTKPSRTSTSR